MAVPKKGQIVYTESPKPIIRVRQIAASQTFAIGDPVGFDANGKVILAINTTDGPLGCIVGAFDSDGVTPVSDPSTGASNVKYAQVLIDGDVVMVAGGAIKPFKNVAVDSASKVVNLAKQSIAGTYTQAEIQALQNEVWRKLGQYWGKASETDALTISDAALNDLIVVRVRGGN